MESTKRSISASGNHLIKHYGEIATLQPDSARSFAKLEEILRELRTCGCRYAYLDTMSFQAPGFYQRLGYSIAGELPDWDSHGHAKFFLIKQLTS